MYALWFVWAIMFIDLVASVLIPLIVSMAPMHIMSFYTLILSIPKNLRHCKYAKTHDIMYSKFFQKPQFYFNLNYMSRSKPKLTRMRLWYIHIWIICYNVQMNTVNCACECILFKFKIARVLCGALDYRQSMWTLIRKNIFQHRMRKHQDIDEVWLGRKYVK